MKNLIIVFIFIFGFSLQIKAQDIIITTKGETIAAKISTIDDDQVTYKKFKNLNGPDYILKKSKIKKITFENGIEEDFSKSSDSKHLNLVDLKQFIMDKINKHGFEEDSFKSRYKAVFEGDLLRLTEMRKSGKKETRNSIVYDFSNVYRFDRISVRSDEKAFINIWVSILKNKKKNKFDKHKLIMRVDSPKNATIILNALKDLNKLLID